MSNSGRNVTLPPQQHSKEHVISAEVVSILNLKGTVGQSSMAMDIGAVLGVEASHLSD
ncbi:MAG: hypothetical protein ISS52_08190 [Dehalococcoidia bacterium]|nr:hypothetical protein [Dehalococcoidia bacterium]